MKNGKKSKKNTAEKIRPDKNYRILSSDWFSQNYDECVSSFEEEVSLARRKGWVLVGGVRIEHNRMVLTRYHQTICLAVSLEKKK